MKLLVMLIFVGFQMIGHSAAHAWSPIDQVGSTVEKMQHCYWITASSDDSQEDGNENTDEEEVEAEPDCD